MDFGFTLKMNVFSQELGMIIGQLFLERRAVWKKTKKHGTGGIPMPALDYERPAMHGEPMPAGLTFPDQCMFQALAALYSRYRLKLISREQASVEKKQLLREHEAFSYRWSLGDHYAEVIKRTETARTAYRKDRTLENADALLRAIDGVTF